jgi:hypothetical protein
MPRPTFLGKSILAKFVSHRHFWIVAAHRSTPVDPFKHRTQRQHIYASKDSQRPFAELGLHCSRAWKEIVFFPGSQSRLIRDLHRQEVGRRAQLPFAIELPPAEHLVGIHVVSPCHSRDRGSRHQRLFDNRSPFRFRPPNVLPSRYPPLQWLFGCVHNSSLWTQTKVPTKTIIFNHSLLVHTVTTGRFTLLATLRVDVPGFSSIDDLLWRGAAEDFKKNL